MKIFNKKKYQVRISYFVKLVTTYSLLLTLSVSILFYTQYSYLIPMISEADMKFELEAFNKLSEYTEDIYRKILSDTIVGMYSQTEMISTIKMINHDKDVYYDTDMAQKVNNYLKAVTSANSDILDFIIITDNNAIFQSSSKSGRSTKTRYDFTKDENLIKVRKSKDKLDVISDNPSRYIINGSKNTVTFIGNMYDPNNPSSKDSIGNFIINVDLDTFKRSYREYENNLNGELLILDESGTVLFNSNSQYDRIGKKYIYYDKIKDVTNEEIMLDEPTLVRADTMDNGKLIIVNILPSNFAWNKLSGLRDEMVMMLVISITAGIIITTIISLLFNKRIKTLIRYMRKVQKGDLDVYIPVRSKDEIGQLSAIFNEMCHKLNAFIKREYFAEINRKNSELQVLQSQINPHFLYNTLESIKMKAVLEGQEEISNMLTILGSIFRWNVKTKDKIVMLEDEVDYISSYLELIKYRFDGNLEVKINMEDRLLKLGIPKLLLQPIVENSVVHGISNIEGMGRIAINGRQEEELLHISVADNGIGIEEDDLQELSNDLNEVENSRDYYRLGIKNVHDRIKLIFGSDYGLSITSVKGRGTTVDLRIPALSIDEMRKLT